MKDQQRVFVDVADAVLKEQHIVKPSMIIHGKIKTMAKLIGRLSFVMNKPDTQTQMYKSKLSKLSSNQHTDNQNFEFPQSSFTNITE